MTQTQYAPYGAPPPPRDYGAPPRSDLDMGLFLRRWLRVWVALITVVLIVVIVYLFFITNSLASIDDRLAPTEKSVVGAGSSVQRLPDQVEAINKSLESIDPSLKPIDAKLDQIIGALTPIDNNLKVTGGSLVSTASMLQRVTNQANDIRGVVTSAQTPGSAGTELIWRQLQVANNLLDPGVRSDARNIVAGLQDANAHLRNVP